MKYKEILNESIPRTLYHGSKHDLPIGTVLLPGIFTKSLKTIRLTEKILNKFKPRSYLARTKSVFMTDDPTIIERVGGNTDYIFKVVPNGLVEKNNVGWWNQINSEIRMFLKYGGTTQTICPYDFEEMAVSYWKGSPCENGFWEYRVSSATIIERIKDKEKLK